MLGAPLTLCRWFFLSMSCSSHPCIDCALGLDGIMYIFIYSLMYLFLHMLEYVYSSESTLNVAGSSEKPFLASEAKLG